MDTGEILSAAGPKKGEVLHALSVLADAEVLVGHNVVNYDIPAIQMLHPWWEPRGLVRDTIVLARLLIPRDRLFTQDSRERKIPTKLYGGFSLEAFGHRLGEYKGDFKGPWSDWAQEMQDYCVQDVAVTGKLLKHLEGIALEWGIDPWDGDPAVGQDAIQLEHDVARIVSRQERFGFSFDRKAAGSLHAELVGRKAELEEALQLEFPPKVVTSVFIPKRPNSAMGYLTGVPVEKSLVVPFNPGSRKQIAERLMALGWKPEEYTEDGTPKLDDEVISALPYSSAKVLGEYLMISKRLGQLSEGKQALLKVEKQGRIHGRVTTNGAVTGRMTHSGPNMAQLPKVGTPYGDRFRALMRQSLGRLVGCDADALEMRCLAHFMAPYDKGAYCLTVDEGDKALGTDAHTVNCLALGLEPKRLYEALNASGRDVAKTWFYAFIYGAGDWKLGNTRTGLKTPKTKVSNVGRADRAQFLTGLPALKALTGAIKKIVEGSMGPGGVRVGARDWLKGIDGRRIFVRSSHSALNTLLQSAGALVMKRALVIMDQQFLEAGMVPGVDYEYVANVHDEVQIDAKKQHVQFIEEVTVGAIKQSGVFYNFRCPLKGNADSGENWAETH